MSNKLVTMQQVRLIIHYLQRGLSGRKMAKELGISRNTVKLYTDRLLGSIHSLDQLRTLTDTMLSAVVYPSLEKLAQDPRRSDFTQQIPELMDEQKNRCDQALALGGIQKKSSGRLRIPPVL